jgi:hypothetical protein
MKMNEQIRLQTFVSLLDQVANDLVVKELNRHPLNALSEVFFLLRLQSEFNEELLKLLIAVVDAELLKAVNIYNFNN